MRYAAAAALVAIALAFPASGQHGASHGGFSGHSGFSGQTGLAGHSGFAGSGGISRPAAPFRNGGFASPGIRRLAPPARSAFRVPYRGGGFSTNRPLYRPGVGNHSYGWGSYHGRGHGPWVVGTYGYYGYGYPGWWGYPYGYPYPYVIDPGFYDWGDSGDSGYNRGGYGYDSGGYAPGYADGAPYANSTPYPDYGPPPPQSGYAPAPPAAATARQPYGGSTASVPPSAEPPLTVIFRNGRTPETMQNYLMSSKSLTNLDRQRYEQIPLDQIDIAATEQTNRARGVLFQVPGGSRD